MSLAAGRLPRRQDRRVHGRLVPTPGSPTGCSSRPRNHCRREHIPWCVSDRGCHCRWPGWLDLMGRYGLARSTGAKELFSGRRRRGGVLRSNEDGVRLSRALGRRGARLGRRLHPLARPRAHQTVARLDESGTIPSKPRNGCVITSKKRPQPLIYSPRPDIKITHHPNITQ